MPVVKFSRVVSFSDEDPPAFKAENLLSTDGTLKWRSSSTGASKMTALLELANSVKINQVDIGNEGSAFVEIQVGRHDMNTEEFKTLLPASSFMSPLESRNEKPLNRVRMFSQDKLNAEVSSKKWDRVKIVCTQPFNKHLKYGLAFLSISAPNEKKVESQPSPAIKRLGAFAIKDEKDSDDSDSLPVGSFFKNLKKDRESMSAAAELRSGKTLADFALEHSNRDEEGASSNGVKRKAEIPNSFYQLQRDNKNKKAKREGNSSGQKLPRRDTLPGESPQRNNKEKNANTSKSSSSDKKKKKPEKPKSVKPFNQLFNGVTFTISGIQNPERADIRQLALHMGAKYKPDWDNSCTHLICAFANTPKFNTVKKKGGKIVKKEWITKGSQDRKRYPWRRFCLDPKDKGDESEEEVWDENLVSSSSSDNIENKSKSGDENDDDEMNTDDEIQAFKEEQERLKKMKKVKNIKRDSEQKQSVMESESSDDAYNAETDVDEDNEDGISQPSACKKLNSSITDHLDFPELPDVFSELIFFLYGSFSELESKKLSRKIVAGGGKINQYMSKDVNYVVTESDWDPEFDEALAVNPEIKFVRPDFVHLSFEKGDLATNKKNIVVKKERK